MEKVDIVIVGAEGVVENGGIINKVGASVLPSSVFKARRYASGLGHRSGVVPSCGSVTWSCLAQRLGSQRPEAIAVVGPVLFKFTSSLEIDPM